MGRRASAPVKSSSRTWPGKGNQVPDGRGDGVYHKAGFLKKSGGG